MLFRAYVRELTRDNHYSNGNSTGAYPCNGYSSDWFYENSPSLGQTFPFLTEIGGGTDGFWAPTNRILPLASENLKANLFSAWAGGAYAKLQTSTILDSSGDGDLQPGERFTLQLRLRNFGQDPTTSMYVALSSGTLQLDGPSAAVGPLAAHADTTIRIDGRVPITSPTGAPASIVVTVKPGGLVEQKDTVKCVIGRSQLLFADGAEEEPLKWTSIGWGKTPVTHAGQWSFTDSPSGQYLNNSTATMTLLAPVHIIEAAAITQLRFWSRWDTEPGYDYGQVGVSSDGGKSWINVSGGHASYYDRMCYTGWQAEWVEENLDLSSFAGKDVLLRFVLSSDGDYRADGWYVDDITIRSYPIAGLSYAHDVHVLPYGVDTLRITARVENPLAHALSVNATLTDRLGVLIDSLSLKDDGLHGDSASADGIWGYQYVPKKDDTIHVTIRTDDLSAGTSKSLPDAAVFVFMRRPIISVSLSTINLGLVPRFLSSRDTLFSMLNTGFSGDLIHVKIDTGNVSPSAALTVHPADFLLPGHTSRACTVAVSPSLLAANITFTAKIIVDADSGFGQTHYEIPLRFRVVTTDGFAAEPGLPTEYGLGHNYPNPFNPSTTIRYGLPNRSHVSLTVFNTLGQQVALLQNGDQEAGYHDVRFDGSGLSSGVYFYQMQAGGFVQTRRLILLR